MRLTAEQARIIRETARHIFGTGTRVLLFGSRTDDGARGGDIDLYIETHLQDPEALVRAEIAFLAELKARMGERKIDLLVRRQGVQSLPPIYEHARATGIPL